MSRFVWFLLILMFASCTKDKTVPATCESEVSFVADVQPIILNSCATSGCHSASSAANNMVFENFEAVFANRDMILKTVNHEAGVTPMPIGASQLSSIEIQNIACWIEQGAPNN